jgi:PRTRC genetic system protein B
MTNDDSAPPANALGLALAGAPVDGEHQARLARLDVFEESLVLTRYRRDGQPAICYEVDPGDLASAFSGVPINTGLLPPYCLWYARAGGETAVGIYVAPRKAELTVAAGNSRHTYRVPLPGLIFCGLGTAYRVYAVRDLRVEATTQLYHAPFPNVYPNGNVCPGTVQFPPCDGDAIWTAFGLFLRSEFNHDLRQGKSLRHPEDVTALWAEFDGRPRYPRKDLLPWRFKRLEDLVEGRD